MLKILYNEIRISRSCCFRRNLRVSLIIIGFGFVFGWFAKVCDSSGVEILSNIGTIGDHFGIWIFAGTMVAVYSSSPKMAAVKTALFFISLIGGYYIYTVFFLGYFPIKYIIVWIVFSICAIPAGSIIWYAKNEGILPAIISAVPTMFSVK